MSDVLSQNEIDDLLSALSTGSVDANELKQEHSKKKIKLYDFRRPNKFSKDQIHTLQVIYENYSRALGTFLSGHLRTSVHIVVLSVEQVSYEEFIRSIPSTTMLNIFSLYPLEGNAIMEINPNLGFAFMDRLMGGPGIPPEKVRAVTEIEQTLMEGLGQRMLDFLREPWEGIIDLQPVLERVETNPQFTQLVSPSEVMIIVSLETKMGDVVGVINICIPFLVLEPIIHKLSVHYYYSTVGKKRSNEDMEVIQTKIKNAHLSVKVVLGKTTITVNDLLELAPGDVIPLDQSVKEGLEVMIGQNTKFYGNPGVYQNKVAVQVIRAVEEGEQDE
ncbi:MAG: flagellar motor switch protein FliM [Bacillota bacterium]|nr:flagellar motor switch protein FliM [Bacillota bacterium]